MSRRRNARPQAYPGMRRETFSTGGWVLIGLTVVLIVAGIVAMLFLVRDTSPSEPEALPAPTGSFVKLECPPELWYDASINSCLPRAECPVGQVVNEDDNTCIVIELSVTAVAPSSGLSTGGTEVRVTGTGFEPGATLAIDGIEAQDITVVDDTTITGITAGSENLYPVDVEVSNPAGELFVLDNAFVYVAPEVKRITEINPPTGSKEGGEAVIIKGVDFAEGVVVSFFGRPATEVVVLDPSTLRVTTPAGPVGPVNVNVRNPGEETYTDTGGFEYVDAPPRVVTGVRPEKGAEAGGTKVTIRGTGFADGATVTFAGKPARKVKVVSSTKITAVTPAGQLGEVEVGVKNPGLPVALLDGAFTYVSAPTITSVKPAEGPTEGGTKVTIKGTGFGPDAVVAVGNVILEKATVVNTTTITIVMPPAAEPITVDISVTNPGEPRALAKQAFTYTETAPEPSPSPKPTP